MTQALRRWGGLLVSPRATVASLRTDEGGWDEVWLLLLYLVGTQVWSLARGLATLIAMPDFGSVISLLSILGRGLITPILVLVVAETVLGRPRAHRRTLVLPPMIVVASLAHLARQAGVELGPLDSAYVPPIIGAALGLGWVVYARPSVPPNATSSDQDGAA